MAWLQKLSEASTDAQGGAGQVTGQEGGTPPDTDTQKPPAGPQGGTQPAAENDKPDSKTTFDPTDPKLNAFIDKIIDAKHKEWQTKHQQDLDAAKAAAQKDADDKAAEAKGEFERLANERKDTITTLKQDLKTRDAELATLRDMVNKTLEVDVAALPAPLQRFDPLKLNPNASVQDRMAWLTTAKEAAKEWTTQQPAAPGSYNGGGPKPSDEGPKAMTKEEQEYAEHVKANRPFSV